METKPIKGTVKQVFILVYREPDSGGDRMLSIESTNVSSARQVGKLQLTAKYGEQARYITILDVYPRTQILHESRIM